MLTSTAYLCKHADRRDLFALRLSAVMEKEELDASLSGLNDPGHEACTLAPVNVAVVCLYTVL